MNIFEVIDIIELFTRQYQDKIPYYNKKEFIQDIVMWLDEFYDNKEENLIINAISLIIKGIKSDFKFNYKTTMFIQL